MTPETYFLIFGLIILSAVLFRLVLSYGKRLSEADAKLSDANVCLEKEQRRVREQAVLNDIVSNLAGELDKNSVAETLMDGVKSLVNAEASALVTAKNGSLTGFYTSLGPSKECKIGATGIIKQALAEGLPIRSFDVRRIEGYKGFPEKHPIIGSFMSAPVLKGNEVIGLLMAVNSIGRPEFSPQDEDSLLALAFQASSALEKADLFDAVVRLAATDGLTGLSNHRTFKERLAMELERAARFQREVALLMLDLDHFKAFNDTFGHPEGDALLKTVSNVIVESIRTVDSASRYGGEEFAVILIESSIDNARMVAERIRESIECCDFLVSYVSVNITVSIGVAMFPADAESLEELIDRADRALYHSKRTGRNKVAVFSDIK